MTTFLLWPRPNELVQYDDAQGICVTPEAFSRIHELRVAARAATRALECSQTDDSVLNAIWQHIYDLTEAIPRELLIAIITYKPVTRYRFM